jgi:hypothetical protein
VLWHTASTDDTDNALNIIKLASEIHKKIELMKIKVQYGQCETGRTRGMEPQ